MSSKKSSTWNIFFLDVRPVLCSTWNNGLLSSSPHVLFCSGFRSKLARGVAVGGNPLKARSANPVWLSRPLSYFASLLC